MLWGWRQAKHFSEAGELVHHNIHNQLARFWVQRLSFPFSNHISIQVKGLGHCRVAVVVVSTVLQEETKWPRHPQEVHGWVLGLWVSDHPHNMEVHDWESVRMEGLQACSWSPRGSMGSCVLVARPTQIRTSLRKLRPNRATCFHTATRWPLSCLVTRRAVTATWGSLRVAKRP